MAKIPVKRYGRRGADYLPAVRTRKSSSQFSVGVKGMSYTFAHNWEGWKDKTEEWKQTTVDVAIAKISETVKHIGLEAIKRCPHFSGSLEKSIKVSLPQATSLSSRGRIEATVGVLSSWKSSYDDRVLMPLSKKTGMEYPTSSPELLAYIHEAYDQFIVNTKSGMRRKRRKEGLNGGARVGSHFLYRAWYDSETSTHIVSDFAKRLRVGLLSEVVDDYESQDAVNADLSKYASTFDEIDEDEIDGEV